MELFVDVFCPIAPSSALDALVLRNIEGYGSNF